MSEHDWSKYKTVVTKRWDYYGPRFERFARGKYLSWNWAAFVATLAWLRYRKLYAWSWAYFFVSTPFLLPISLAVVHGGDPCERALDPGPSFAALMVFASLPGWILPPLFANLVYFKHVRTLIRKSKKATGTGSYGGALALQALVLIGFMLVIPSYAHYSERVMVSETVSLVHTAKEYLKEHQRLPARIEEIAGWSSKYVDRVVLEPDGTIRAFFGDKAGKLSGHSVAYVPVIKDGLVVDWLCRDLPDPCLPRMCRRP